MTEPETLSLRQFALRLGIKNSYVHELKKADRLVLTPDGKRVLVAASKQRIDATRDPSKSATVARHAQARGAPVLTGAEPAPAAPSQPAPQQSQHQAAAADNDADAADPTSEHAYSFADAKAKREFWAAEREHAQFKKEAGELMERGEVVAACASAGSIFRTRLEAWAAVLPPQLQGQDEAQMRSTLADQVHMLLTDLAQVFGRLGEAKP